MTCYSVRLVDVYIHRSSTPVQKLRAFLIGEVAGVTIGFR